MISVEPGAILRVSIGQISYSHKNEPCAFCNYRDINLKISDAENKPLRGALVRVRSRGSEQIRGANFITSDTSYGEHSPKSYNLLGLWPEKIKLPERIGEVYKFFSPGNMAFVYFVSEDSGDNVFSISSTERRSCYLSDGLIRNFAGRVSTCTPIICESERGLQYFVETVRKLRNSPIIMEPKYP